MSDIFNDVLFDTVLYQQRLFRDTARAFKFGDDLTRSCSNVVYAGAQEPLLESRLFLCTEEETDRTDIRLFICSTSFPLHRTYSGRPFRRYIVWSRGLARSTAPNQRS